MSGASWAVVGVCVCVCVCVSACVYGLYMSFWIGSVGIVGSAFWVSVLALALHGLACM